MPAPPKALLEPEVPSIRIRWDVQDVMRALPELNYHEAVAVLHKVSDYWKPREIGLLRRLIVESGAHSGEPEKYLDAAPGDTKYGKPD